MVGVKTEMMENRERKIRWKMTFSTISLRGGGGEKGGGTHKFSLLPLQNTISPNWRENWSEKWEKYFDKTTPTSFLHFWLLFFFFFLLLFLCIVGFLFFFFFFLSLVLSGGGVLLLLFLLFFFLNFYFYYFFKKTLLDDFLHYFLKCPLSSIH